MPVYQNIEELTIRNDLVEFASSKEVDSSRM
jgi:hypothetical protein